MLTRKDYVELAEILKLTHSDNAMTANATLEVVGKLIANYCEQDNPRFKREKFLTACGIS